MYMVMEMSKKYYSTEIDLEDYDDVMNLLAHLENGRTVILGDDIEEIASTFGIDAKSIEHA